MKVILTVFLAAIFSCSCSGQIAHNKTTNKHWAFNLTSLSKDSLDKLCNNSIKDLTRTIKTNKSDCDLYYLNGKIYTGWACEIIPNNIHKYRYEQFKNGKMISRIAYYDNGQIDGDFRMQNCKNYGVSRMWLYNGKMYIDELYILPGIKDGMQKQWHDNGVLAKESKYENGELLFEKKYDRKGNELAK